MISQIEYRLQNLFRTVFKNSDLNISPAMSSKDIEDWDSLAQISLLVAIEKEFGFSLTADEFLHMKSVGEIIQIVERKIKLKNHHPEACEEVSRPKNATPIYKRRIAILSNFSTQMITGHLQHSLAVRDIKGDIFEDNYDQWELSPRRLDSDLYQFQPDFVVMLLSSLPFAYSPQQTPEKIAERIHDAIHLIETNTHAKILLTLPEALEEDSGPLSWQYQWHQRLIACLVEKLPVNCITYSFEPLIRKLGRDQWFANSYFIQAKIPFHPKHGSLIADDLANLIANAVAPRVKLIVTDLDNTLWHGIVGEVGTHGVDLDAQGEGLSGIKLQKFLAHLKTQGVLLAIASKNNLKDAIEVFKSRKEMILKIEDFVAIQINWQKKSETIAALLQELKLSTTGVVFLDDSAFERAEVRQAFPDLIVPELDADPNRWVSQLSDLGIFSRASSSEGDKDRSALYSTEAMRLRESRLAENDADFLKTLGLKLSLKPYASNRDRVIDLISKTNQFNLTTRRHSLADLEQLLAEGSQFYIFAAEDKFGSYGIIGVVIAKPVADGRYLIDTWLMSCRVIGRRFEMAMFEYFSSDLKRRGCKILVGDYIATGKNLLVSKIYEDLGFKIRTENSSPATSSYELHLGAITEAKIPHYCEIVRSAF